ncbi:MAG: hypothetical protein ACLFOY_06095 [Desulfatibacillaceae bacterium]
MKHFDKHIIRNISGWLLAQRSVLGNTARFQGNSGLDEALVET